MIGDNLNNYKVFYLIISKYHNQYCNVQRAVCVLFQCVLLYVVCVLLF